MPHTEPTGLHEPLFGFKRVKNFLRKKFKRISGCNHDNRNVLDEIINDEHDIDSDERVLIDNVLDLRGLTAQNIMLPRADIIAVPDSISGQDLIRVFIEKRVSRIIVFTENLDRVNGFLEVKDAIAWGQELENFDIKKWVREVLFISPAMRALDLLLHMRETGKKVAIVVDEHGGVDGMITFVQLIEELVGEIQEAHTNTLPPQVLIKPDGSIVADARLMIEELDETVEGGQFQKHIKDNDIETLGGWVIFIAGRVPVIGELIRHESGIEFEVMDADPRRVKKVALRNWENADFQNNTKN